MRIPRDVRNPLIIFFIGCCLGLAPSALYVISKYGGAFIDSKCEHLFPLTEQILDCTQFDTNAAAIKTLDATLNAATAQYIAEKRATGISVWVRDLTSKQYASVNELDVYDPASLLKLPLAITYYKFSEIQPSALSDRLVYATPSELNEQYNYFTASTSLAVGQSYAVEDLIDRMIVASDNGAYYALLHHISSDVYTQTLQDLGIEIPTDTNVLDFVTAKTYGSIFRLLYNSSYLNRSHSEHLLELMSKEQFIGLQASIPSSTDVAHKFGERSVYDQNGNLIVRELHDCGIVYKSGNPYSICIMTKGSDFTALQRVIQDISHITYDAL